MLINKYLQELFKFLVIPSISAQNTHRQDMYLAAFWLSKKLNLLGFSSKTYKTEGHPIVFAEKMINKKYPTLLIYGHYDVQSPDPLEEWKSDPFKPEIRNGNIYSRGVADDKGQLYTWLAAIDTLKIKKSDVKVNIKFIIEGEEEVGSKNFASFILKNKKLLKSDICVISDSHCLSEKKPVIGYGLRGIVYTELKIITLNRDVHSGLYGGNVANPAQILSDVISKLKNNDGLVTIPNFYRDVRKLSSQEKMVLKKFPFTEKEIKKETGAIIAFGEKQYSIVERSGARPTLEINGIGGGYQGEGPKTIIPKEASAKISMRIVPNQKAKDIYSIFEMYVKKLIPRYAKYELKLLSTAEAVIVNTKNNYFKSAENAYYKVFNKKPLYELSGGTIGAAADIKNILGIDSIMMGYGLPDDNLHSPNEKFSLKMFNKGIKTNIQFLLNLSENIGG